MLQIKCQSSLITLSVVIQRFVPMIVVVRIKGKYCKYSLKNHLKLVGGVKRKFECEFCQKQFKHKK